MRRITALVIACAVCTVSIACNSGPDLEFADWVFPVPEGTPIKEYGPVLLEGRAENAIELVDELVIGGDTTDPNSTFYRPRSVVASDAGHTYVLDAGNNRIQMFDRDGNFVASLGQEGQGPGEFSRPTAATIAGDQLIINDLANSRFSIWTLGGEHVADHTMPLMATPLRMYGLSDGDVVFPHREIAPDRSVTTQFIASFSSHGEERIRFFTAPARPLTPPPPRGDMRAEVQRSIDIGEEVRPRVTVGAGEIVYVTPASEYQVLAYNRSGEMVWALRVAWPRRPVPERNKEMQVDMFSRMSGSEDSELAIDDFDWPSFDQAISSTLRTDGHGRLYVVPYLEMPEEGDPEGMPVDVYSATGERLASGFVSDLWDYARGDFVYTLRPEQSSGEYVVKRHRLVLNEGR